MSNKEESNTTKPVRWQELPCASRNLMVSVLQPKDRLTDCI
jgi:hypothetical protein